MPNFSISNRNRATCVLKCLTYKWKKKLKKKEETFFFYFKKGLQSLVDFYRATAAATRV